MTPGEAEKAFEWIKPIIDCSSNTFHFDCLNNLIESFEKMFPTEKDLALSLKELKQDKWNEVHTVLV